LLHNSCLTQSVVAQQAFAADSSITTPRITPMQRIPFIMAGLLLSVSFATPAHSDLLDDIRSDGTFTVGTEARYAPFEYVEDGEIVGYSADIMKHIMEELEGVELIRMDLPCKAFCRA
jgi:ABC-type amino acid transport substrate-binding protein